MPILDWSRCDAVESAPNLHTGTWVFRHTNTPVLTVIENLEAGRTIKEIAERFYLQEEDIRCVLEFVAQSLKPASGEALIQAMQASPSKDIDLEPQRFAMPVRDVQL